MPTASACHTWFAMTSLLDSWSQRAVYLLLKLDALVPIELHKSQHPLMSLLCDRGQVLWWKRSDWLKLIPEIIAAGVVWQVCTLHEMNAIRAPHLLLLEIGRTQVNRNQGGNGIHGCVARANLLQPIIESNMLCFLQCLPSIARALRQRGQEPLESESLARLRNCGVHSDELEEARGLRVTRVKRRFFRKYSYYYQVAYGKVSMMFCFNKLFFQYYYQYFSDVWFCMIKYQKYWYTDLLIWYSAKQKNQIIQYNVQRVR